MLRYVKKLEKIFTFSLTFLYLNSYSHLFIFWKPLSIISLKLLSSVIIAFHL